MLKLNDRLFIRVKNGRILGQIIGIDSYHLENFEGKQQKWLSYTLISDKAGRYKRYWITDWKKSGWVLWTACKKKSALKNCTMVPTRSGITKIEFSGEQGVSTPAAAVAVYKQKNGEYYAMERFSGSKAMFFAGKEISKPETVS